MVKGTQVADELGEVEQGATRLLGIEGLTVVSVELDAQGARVVHAVTGEETPPARPKCGVVSTSPRGRVRTCPRDVPYGDVPVRLVWHKSRWRCRESACPWGSFTESLPAIPPRARLTVRLREEIGAAAADRFSCVTAAAGHYRVSWPIANTALMAHIATPLAGPLPVVAVLGIDETRRGKPVWEQDPDTGRWRIAPDRWHTGIVDAVGSSGLLAHVEGRTSAAVVDWLQAQPEDWRAGVTHVCIDLSASYANAVRTGLPDAVLVADRFHLVRLANDMLTEVRQRVTREHYGRRGRATDPAWASRRRLLTGYPRLSEYAFERMWNGLIDTGDPGIEILHAYTVKEDLRALLGLAGTHPTKRDIAHRLDRFYQRGRVLPRRRSAPAGPDRRGVVDRHRGRPRHRLLERPIRGHNRLAKHVGRDAFGFRNVNNQRQRIRWACTRQHRQGSAVQTEMPAQA